MFSPDFLIVGAQKAGTTSLHHHLSMHKDFFLPRNKELHFFDRETVSDSSLLRYAKNFDECGKNQLSGEATPIYMFYPDAMEKIRRSTNDSIKIIIIVRHPVHRAYSHYWHEVRTGFEYKNFISAVSRPYSSSEMYLRHHSYVERSCYSSQIDRATDLFGISNVKVVKMEDMISNTLEIVNEVVKFISPSSTPFASTVDEVKNPSMMPIYPRLQNLFSRVNIAVGGVRGARSIIKLNLRQAKYPPLKNKEYNFVREKIIDRDPEILNLYKEM